MKFRQRLYVTNIEIDEETENYIDIEVDKNNNFYSGNFGLINIHNCGVGGDISTLRPKSDKVTNAAGNINWRNIFYGEIFKYNERSWTK